METLILAAIGAYLIMAAWYFLKNALEIVQDDSLWPYLDRVRKEVGVDKSFAAFTTMASICVALFIFGIFALAWPAASPLEKALENWMGPEEDE